MHTKAAWFPKVHGVSWLITASVLEFGQSLSEQFSNWGLHLWANTITGMISNHIIQCILWKTKTLKAKSTKSQVFLDSGNPSAGLPGKMCQELIPSLQAASDWGQRSCSELVTCREVSVLHREVTHPHIWWAIHSSGVTCFQRINVHFISCASGGSLITDRLLYRYFGLRDILVLDT